MKLVALFIVAFTTASYAGDHPSTRPVAPDPFPNDLFHLSLQPAFPTQISQPPLPLSGHIVKQIHIDLIPANRGPSNDAMLLPLASIPPRLDLIDDRR